MSSGDLSYEDVKIFSSHEAAPFANGFGTLCFERLMAF
jgi:hypothetical protein